MHTEDDVEPQCWSGDHDSCPAPEYEGKNYPAWVRCGCPCHEEKEEADLAQRALSARMHQPNDAGVDTVRDYLVVLLVRVWQGHESFNGKRTFGNSGWMSDFDFALINAGLVDGTLDENDCVETVDDEAVDRLILLAISHLR